MKFFREWGAFMMMGARAHARWEIGVSNTILHDRKRIVILGLLLIPILLGGLGFADDVGDVLPDVLGGKKAYSPAHFTVGIFVASILIARDNSLENS